MKTSRLFFLLPFAAASLVCLSQPAHAGYWQLTYQCQGSSQENNVGSPEYPYRTSSTTSPWSNAPQSDGSLALDGGGIIRGLSSASANDTGTVTATLTWVPTNGDAPTGTTLTVCEDGSVLAAYDYYPYSFADGPFDGTADDGLGDPAVQITGEALDGKTSSGKHLLTLPIVASGGTYTVTLPTRTLTASGSISDTSDNAGFPNHNYLDAFINYDVVQDSRTVTITSSIDPSYHKDTVTSQPVENQPASDGTMNADSVQLGDVPGAAIAYFANPVGSWAANSSYHWYSTLTGYSGAGTFTLPSDPPYGLDVPYGNNVNFANQEHINLHCIDAGDGASATANYYVNWHNDFDDWITVVDTKDYGSIVRISPVYRPVLDDAKFSYDVENSVKVDEKATGEGSLDAGAVGAKFGVELGAEFESATKTTVEYPLAANEYNWVERQAYWRHREGTVDNYGFHGYIGLLHWTLDSAFNPNNPLIDYVEFQRVSSSPPSY